MQSDPQQSIDDDAADRASERCSFFLAATLTTKSHGDLHARVRNLSAGGMMIERSALPDAEIEPGLRIVTELRGIGRVKGEIAWGVGNRFGVKFDRPVDPERARKPVTGTPSVSPPGFLKPVLVPDRALKRLKATD